jgi:type II secretory ATPase GspE/PulE/Tfp pilus assembly ATPase PilB-like protein
MKVEPFLLVSTLNVVIGQRLVRRLTDSKEQYSLTKAEFAQLEKVVDLDRVMTALKADKILKEKDTWDSVKFWRPTASAGEDGFKGRIAIHEILKMSLSIKELIMKNATSAEIEKQAKAEGMLTMIEDGIYQCVHGLTTIEEVLRVVSE